MKLLNVSLWILQFLISALFISSACMKLAMPIDRLASMYPWTGQVSPVFVRTMGIIDLIGGIGILAPSRLRIRPVIAAYAAIGIVLLMVAACVFHIARGEAQVIGFNIVVGVIAGVIAWGRLAR